MAYKKYITKNGKIYGPYVYHSKRINGKVVSEYHGINKEEKTKKTFLFILGGTLILALIIWTLFFQVQSTGRIVLDLKGVFEDGSLSSGKINFYLKGGELIPMDSVLLIENENNTYQYPLKDLLQNQELLSGNYYLEDKKISGSGQGYGLIGIQEEFPTISFEIELTAKQTSEGGTTETPIPPQEENQTEPETNLTEEETTIEQPNETIEQSNETIEPEIEPAPIESPQEETPLESTPTEEIPPIEIIIEPTTEEVPQEEPQAETSPEPEVEPTPTEAPQEEEPKPETSPEPESTPSPSPITGNAISKLIGGVSSFLTGWITNEPQELEIISGEVSKNKDFVYTLKNQEIKVLPETIKLGEETISPENLKIITTKDQLTIKTNYSTSKQGFGEEYLNNNSKTLEIDLSNLNLILTEGNLKVKLIYNESEIFSFDQELSQEYLDEIQKNKTEIEKIIETVFNLTNQTINETIKLGQNFTLTEEEKKILTSRFAFPVVQTEITSYRDRLLVLFSIGDYSIEYSYEDNLSNETFQANIERDRYLFLKDIINSFSKETYSTRRLTDLEQDYPIF